MKSRVSNKKTATKGCPNCSEQVPTACKSCNCGHLFKRYPSQSSQAEPPQTSSDAMKRRRTQRTRRERPHFYNSIDYEQHFPRRRRKSSKCSDDSPKKKKPVAVAPPPKTTTPSTSKDEKEIKEKEEKDNSGSDSRESANRTPKEEDPFANIGAEKAWQYGIILQEINRKFGIQNFNPI